MNETADLCPVFGLDRQNKASVTDSDVALLQILLRGLVLHHLVKRFPELHTGAVDLAADSGKLGTRSVSYLVFGDDRTFKLFEQPVVR